MNTQVQNTMHRKSATSLLLAGLLALTSAPVFAADSFQEKVLFDPSEGMLKAEARGRIMIYDGLDVATVDKALDEQFDRIDNMMFTRVHHPLENGGVEVENDGC